MDRDGRQRLFHGVNVVIKSPPFHPPSAPDAPFDPWRSLSDVDIDHLREWGFNVVRLGLMWPGMEPHGRRFNHTYFGVIEGIVDRLSSRGIYTILDLHQDLFSEPFCGEGIPSFWVEEFDRHGVYTNMDDFPAPILPPFNNTDKGTPSTSDCDNSFFVEYYLSQRVSKSFQALYDDVAGAQTALSNVWRYAASRFRENPHVLGYELMNEPWTGDFYNNLTLLLVQGHSDYANLRPFYQRLTRSIREVDRNHIIFFEKAFTSIFKSGLRGDPLNLGADDPGGVFSYHIYCSPFEAGKPISWSQRFLCRLALTVLFRMALWDLRRLDGATNRKGKKKKTGGAAYGGFMTEFGEVDGVPEQLEPIKALLDMADVHHQSWTWWAFKTFPIGNDKNHGDRLQGFWDVDTGELKYEKVRVLSRTYPMAIAGALHRTSFDPATGLFVLTYEPDPCIHAPTVVYLNEGVHYPHGYTVRVTPPESVTVERAEDKNRLEIRLATHTGDRERECRQRQQREAEEDSEASEEDSVSAPSPPFSALWATPLSVFSRLVVSIVTYGRRLLWPSVVAADADMRTLAGGEIGDNDVVGRVVTVEITPQMRKTVV
ncbi:unnamed protein product [Vitrella brassicaformis CCMP3155]|uniref:Glycoside hydrolase family 5 domain-containing protein n=2 Tax=Vitrella brassicaformis TaxID=1169539 RepID=A0A0G4GN20_VITBC|nr:unnamed protein product [Vitrella brassicaformis CCMP3155]|eukprot:CEM31595.1 unnamed protein product [Vitrella brassicaformis CCMP3155]